MFTYLDWSIISNAEKQQILCLGALFIEKRRNEVASDVVNKPSTEIQQLLTHRLQLYSTNRTSSDIATDETQSKTCRL